MTTMREFFNNELYAMNTLEVRSLTEKLMDLIVPPHFMTDNAADSPDYTNLYTGQPIKLADRTKAGARLFLLMRSNPEVSKVISLIEQDCILAALIFRDIYIRGYDAIPTTSTIFEHPIMMKQLKPNYLESAESNLYDLISDFVASHHGDYNSSPRTQTKLPVIKSMGQFYVHFFDVLAAKRVVMVDMSNDYNTFKNYYLR